MMVIMKHGHTQGQFDSIMRRLEELSLTGHPIVGVERTVIAVVGHIYPELRDEMETMPGVEDTVPISVPYKLASRETKRENTVIKVGSGGNRPREENGYRRPLCVRGGRAADGDGARGEGSGRAPPARRRLQAAHVALQLPRPGGGGPAPPRSGA